MRWPATILSQPKHQKLENFDNIPSGFDQTGEPSTMNPSHNQPIIGGTILSGNVAAPFDIDSINHAIANTNTVPGNSSMYANRGSYGTMNSSSFSGYSLSDHQYFGHNATQPSFQPIMNDPFGLRVLIWGVTVGRYRLCAWGLALEPMLV